ncbi:Phospho-N-acetylmuramoyl-pentapeptide-transferase [Marinilactibacillus piezotolerans]|uniref:Phospho-N-acetylmuramoyl-pentapeptide-transferase n=1 Tax=Marinilactibacillus piezotolerans TaxID=258723 RepID=A0A1I3ZB79_9LACT|nr:phospho-N-acetylmuramoyl-pentapeptide-transferase [Marinilactibacillus piezotolerans]SFK41130.1 Phospho-N-acetylmuramoyl-pentapeptide-transferase [Marinilactibacillus piezotolerans]
MLELLRTVTPVLVSFIITVISMPFVIQYFSKKQLGQVTREEGPTWHESKSGTPTMGGVSFIFAVTITVLILSYFLDVFTTGILLLTFILILYGLIGFLDDYIKVIMKRNLGLTSLQKLIGQIIGGVVFYIGLNLLNYPTVLDIPILGSIDLGWGYGLFLLFWLVGFSNATNLTDGIDGLMASTGMIAYLAYGVIAGIQDQWDIMVFSLSVFGGLLGFFIFNKKPAKVFMGDVGSLALGAGLAGISILLNQEWTLILIGIIFVCETASVMLQVSSFKLRGKRIFKMSPIHHHYEMVGWSEWKIVGIFSLIGFLMALVVLFILV